jgi:glutathione reductase (NADPH)
VKTFDLLVLGSGPSGGQVAKRCADAGWSVGMIEARDFGGNCALRGCNPKKVLVRAAEVVDWARRSDGRLCKTDGIGIDWKSLIEFTTEFTDGVPESSHEKFASAGVELFQGKPRFVDPNHIQIGDETIHAHKIAIAVGARPSTLDFPGSEHVMLSDEFLTQPEIGKRILFIGGGYISFEFAHVANRADSDVVIVEHGDRPLKAFEPTLVNCLLDKMKRIGIETRCNAEVVEVKALPTGEFEVSISSNGSPSQTTVDAVFHGAGRVPNLDGLQLEKANIAYDDRDGIAVDEFLRNPGNPNVFATGDCAATGQPKLTPIANQQGFAVSESLLTGQFIKPEYGFVPAVVFSVPALATVGMTEESARESGKDYRIEEDDLSASGAVRKVCETHARYKLVVDKESDQILGAHLVGPAAAETINLFALAMNQQMTARDLKSMLFVFPTFAAGVRSMV